MNDRKLIKATTLYQLKGHDKEYISKRRNDHFNHFILGALQMGVDFNDEEIHKVEIKESKIHGLGVFAMQDIKKGELITYYPAHYVVLYPEGRMNKGGVKKAYLEGKTVKDHKFECPENARDYEFEINSFYSIAGDPRIYDNLTYVGHMINDGARGHSTYEKYDEKDERIYNMVVRAKCNAQHTFIADGLLSVKTLAMRDIKAGEEILAPYGYGYWKSR